MYGSKLSFCSSVLLPDGVRFVGLLGQNDYGAVGGAQMHRGVGAIADDATRKCRHIGLLGRERQAGTVVCVVVICLSVNLLLAVDEDVVSSLAR